MRRSEFIRVNLRPPTTSGCVITDAREAMLKAYADALEAAGIPFDPEETK